MLGLFLSPISTPPLLNAHSGAQLTMQPNSTLASDLGTEKGLLQGRVRWVAHAPRKPRVPKAFRKVLLTAK